jgi:hypothetical protein
MERRTGKAMVILGMLAGACTAPAAEPMAERGASIGSDTPKENDVGETGESGQGSQTTIAGDSAAPGDAMTAGDAGPALAGQDKNGVAYIAIPGFVYAGERFDWTKNFKSNGSMRHDFEGTPDENQAVVGYFKVDGPDDEEISAKLGGGPHSEDDPEWADCYDIGIIDFKGTSSRLRFEATHPSYQSGPSAKVTGIGDVRNKWVGAMGMKLNVDTDGDGKTDKVRVLAWVDPDGLDAAGKPKNGWKKVFDVTLALADVELKSPTIPYVTTIGQSSAAQATIRIDEQDADSYEYKYVAYRRLVWQ